MSEIVFEWAWRRNDPKLVEDAIGFWNWRKILPPNVKPEVRAKELCAVAYRDGKAVGVSTATIDYMPQFKTKMAVYRCACATALRRVPLSVQITDYTRLEMEKWAAANPEEGVMALAALVESPQLIRNYPSVFGSAEMVFMGFAPTGQPLRVAWFKHATVPLPPP